MSDIEKHWNGQAAMNNNLNPQTYLNQSERDTYEAPKGKVSKKKDSRK